ncbi:hypothetical protein CNMCM5793_005960 [Aspergillus hiratsukae]|uniref:Wax synthase domain-containing protein n=1 Tax=Aspergillus hiratsukae TaxID=1194566 RepID=A0A8H6PGS1_9EURO|nr:hypothetical protein CNMCM5793_005960 [Aspergillus hiratsukae]
MPTSTNTSTHIQYDVDSIRNAIADETRLTPGRQIRSCSDIRGLFRDLSLSPDKIDFLSICAYVGLLLHFGAHVNPPQDCARLTPLQLAVQHRQPGLVQLVLDNKANPNSFTTAKREEPDEGCLLSSTGLADVNGLPSPVRGRTALQEAASSGFVQLSEYLLAHGADVNAPAAHLGGVTALQGAAIDGDIRIVMMLLLASADVNVAPAIEQGLNSIEAAAGNGRLDTLHLLLNYHPDTEDDAPTQTSSYRQILDNNRDQFELLIQHGDYKPFYLWHLLVFTALPLCGLLISRQHGARYLRPVIFALILSTAVDVIRHRRSLLGANGYMGGLVTAWWTIWSATILVFNDAERDFERIERRSSDAAGPDKARTPDNENKPRSSDKPANGHIFKAKQYASQRDSETLAWQPYPRAWLHRLNWAMGLLFNMRGPEWNWRISALDPLPDSLQTQRTTRNGQSARQAMDKTDNKAESQPDARARLNAGLVAFLKHYLLLDLIKVLMMHDPYFWGLVPSASARPFPFTYLPLPTIPGVLVRLYRLTLSGLGVYAALSFVTSLSPVIFLGLSLAFPNASRALTRVPFDAPWLYSATFGSFFRPILDHGLTGCWSEWWHQLFRFGFTSTANFLLSLLPKRLAARPSVRRTVTTVTAFSLSGLIHACGSYTQFADTRPLTPFAFFFLQAIGVIIQTQLARFVNARYSFSRPTRRAANARDCG